ncbi:hypothetical protein PENSPDRAFT_674182 [Peniophora sp. CONT]|nr:hypothetical protein PENSPDRAFT_674182 [Peniophora sp. CONT]
MSTNQKLSTAEVVRAQAAKEVSVGGETLSISKVHMWRNAQPRVSTLAEEALRSTSPQNTRPLSLTMTVKRNSGTSTASTDGLDSSVLPYLVAIHVLREGIPFSAQAELNTSPDDPTSIHYAWPAPPLGATENIAETPAHEGAYFLAQTVDKGSALSLSAWNGPLWGVLRNGLDDMLDFIAVLEFEGGIFLTSERQRVETVY